MKARLIIDQIFEDNFSLTKWDTSGVLIVAHLFSTGVGRRRGPLEMIATSTERIQVNIVTSESSPIC